MRMHHLDPSFDIGTRVITVQSNMEDNLTFSDPIKLKYWIFPPYNSTQRAICSSWNGESWSDEGLHLAARGDNTITCASNHATSFAILLSSQVDPMPLTEENDLVTRIVTYVFAFISLLSMIASLFMLLLLGKTLLKKDLFLIHFNLGISLTFALIFCVLGTQDIPKLASLPVLCQIFAVAFQYFAFASLSWSLCNVIQIIYMLHAKVKLRRTTPIMLVVGWFLPLIVAIPVAGIRWSDYGVFGQHCWLTEDSLTFWLIAGPVLGTNLIILILSLYTIRRISTSKPEAEWSVGARSAVFGLLLMAVVLTVAWGLSLVNFFFPFQFYKWGFAISYTFQGPIFFTFYVIGNISVRRQLFKLKRKSDDWQDPPNHNRRSQGGRTSNDSNFHRNPVIESVYANPLFDTKNMDCNSSDCQGACPSKLNESEYKIELDLQREHFNLTATTNMHFSKGSPYQSMEKIAILAEDNPYMEIQEHDHANPFIVPGIDEEKDASENAEMLNVNPFTERVTEAVIYATPKRKKSNQSVYINQNADTMEIPSNSSQQDEVASNGVAEAKTFYNSETHYDIAQDDSQAEAKLPSEESYVNQGFTQKNSEYSVESLEMLEIETGIGNPCYRLAESSINFGNDRISSEDSDSATDVQ